MIQDPPIFPDLLKKEYRDMSTRDPIAQGVTEEEAELINRMTDRMSLEWYLTGATMTMEQVQHLYTLRGGRVRDAYDRLIAGIRAGK